MALEAAHSPPDKGARTPALGPGRQKRLVPALMTFLQGGIEARTNKENRTNRDVSAPGKAGCTRA